MTSQPNRRRVAKCADQPADAPAKPSEVRTDLAAAAPSPSQDEERAILAAMCRTKGRPVRAELEVQQTGEGTVNVSSPHEDQFGWNARMQDTFGTRTGAFSDAGINWLSNAAAERGKPLSQTTVNAALAVVAAAAPTDEMEALLAVQMFATHDLSMEMMRRAKHATDLRGMTEYGTLATKLSRTMTAQVEALGKLRRGGEQTVRVEHVHVYEGGQAVVGVVNQGGGVHGRANERVHGPDIAATLGPALLGQDATGHGVPVPRNQGEGPVPHPRRRGRQRRPAG